jgi:hypothetical protein
LNLGQKWYNFDFISWIPCTWSFLPPGEWSDCPWGCCDVRKTILVYQERPYGNWQFISKF